jgi:hypothetical protein
MRPAAFLSDNPHQPGLGCFANPEAIIFTSIRDDCFRFVSYLETERTKFGLQGWTRNEFGMDFSEHIHGAGHFAIGSHCGSLSFGIFLRHHESSAGEKAGDRADGLAPIDMFEQDDAYDQIESGLKRALVDVIFDCGETHMLERD